MCTVSFIPTAQGAIITSNRDEDPKRSASGLSNYRDHTGASFHIAREPLHGGTNMAVADDGEVWTLLNGAFAPHKFGKSYRMSRGLMVLEALRYKVLKTFSDAFDFDGIEPFTLLHFSGQIEELRWDGNQRFYKSFNAEEPLIWASAQLYTKEAIEKRMQWFAHLLEKQPGPDEALAFHQYGGDGDPLNDMVMNRGGMVQTVSITQVYRKYDSARIQHLNLIEGRTELLNLPKV